MTDRSGRYDQKGNNEIVKSRSIVTILKHDSPILN